MSSTQYPFFPAAECSEHRLDTPSLSHRVLGGQHGVVPFPLCQVVGALLMRVLSSLFNERLLDGGSQENPKSSTTTGMDCLLMKGVLLTSCPVTSVFLVRPGP